MKELYAKLTKIRPDRSCFVRKLQLGEAPTVCAVFVHGLCGSQAQFGRLVEQLELLGVCAIAVLYDSVGCNKSLPVDYSGYTRSELTSDLIAIVQQFATTRLPLVLIGHSFGSSVFLPALEELKPSAVVLLSTRVNRGRPETPGVANGGHLIMRLPVWLLNCIQSILTEEFIKTAVHPDYHDLADSIRADSNSNNMHVAKGYHNHMEWATPDFLHFSLPTLIVHGADDGIIPVECGQYLHNTLPESEFFVVERSSHMVILERPDIVADHFRAFVDKHFAS